MDSSSFFSTCYKKVAINLDEYSPGADASSWRRLGKGFKMHLFGLKFPPAIVGFAPPAASIFVRREKSKSRCGGKREPGWMIEMHSSPCSDIKICIPFNFTFNTLTTKLDKKNP